MNGSFISEMGMAVIVAVILTPILIYSLIKNIRAKGFRKSLFDNLAIIYFTVVYVLLLFPFHLHAHQSRTPIVVNWLPFRDVIDYFRSNFDGLLYPVVKDFWGNLFIFVPAGVFLSIKKFTNSKAVLFIILFGLSGEVPQLIISYVLGFQYRIIDITDVILNTAGAALGYIITRVVMKRLTWRGC